MQAMIAGRNEQPRNGHTFLLLCYSGARLMLLDAQRRLVPLPYPLARSLNGRWIRSLGMLVRYAQRPAVAHQLLTWLEHDPRWRWSLVPQELFNHNPAAALPARDLVLTWHSGNHRCHPALSWLLQGRLQHLDPQELYGQLSTLHATPATSTRELLIHAPGSRLRDNLHETQ